MNKSYRGRSCPIVVHCSDGAGRTGTYCLIDMVLSRMAKGAKEIDIAATLEHLRDQRPRMVSKIYTNHLLLFYTCSFRIMSLWRWNITHLKEIFWTFITLLHTLQSYNWSFSLTVIIVNNDDFFIWRWGYPSLGRPSRIVWD